jgi:geranylgeranyl reductase family protein
MNQSYDVIVVGAGPAGSTLARKLAEAGKEVVLLEKSAFPRFKACGGGLPLRTQSLMGLDLDEIPHSKVGRVVLTGGKGLDIVVESSSAVAVVRRESFDEWLAKKAVDKGVHLFENHRVVSVANDGSTWSVVTTDGVFRAPFLAACDGAHSSVLRSLKENLPQYCPTMEVVVPFSENAEAIDKVTAVFDFSSLRKGYGWIFPAPGGINIGAGALGMKSTELKKNIMDLAARSPWVSYNLTEIRGAVIPVFKKPRNWYAKNRLYLCGDAAGLADPLTGEGIYYAVLSATLAAEAILYADESHYEKALKRNVLDELSIAARYALVKHRLPLFLFKLMMRQRRFKEYAGLFVRLLEGEMSYREIYALMKGRTID